MPCPFAPATSRACHPRCSSQASSTRCCPRPRAYAARLQAAGVPATFTHYPGASHNFYNMPPTVDVAVRAMSEIIDALKAAFGSAVKA